MNQFRKKIVYPIVLLTSLLIATGVHAETENVEKSYSVSSGGTLIIESDQGSIEVETWDKNEVDVLVEKKARSQSRLNEFKVTVEQRGDDVYVGGDSEWNSKVRVKFKISVPKSYNVDLRTGGGSIKIDDLNGQVKVHTSGGSISIGNVSDGNVDANTSGGSIKVGDVDGDLKVNTSGGSIRLGKVTGVSSIDTSGGSIKLEQGGGDVTADTSGGSINIGPVNGKVEADTSGGSIKIGMAQGEVKADTSGGSVNVEGSKGRVTVESSGGSLYVGSSGGPVKADTAGGSIKILQAKGYIEADTAGGSIEAEMIETDNSVDTHVNLDSSGGSITVYLPEGIEATVSASLRITRSARRDYRIYSDFPLAIKGEKSNRITADGKLNGGGDRVVLNTTNGDIYIKKLEK